MRVIWLLAGLAGCTNCGTYTTPLGINYLVIDGAHLDINRISAAQLDQAYLMSEPLWHFPHQRPHDLIVRFWDHPMLFNGQLDAGASWNTNVNIYIKPNDEGCLFRVGNEGTLVHELGHALLFINNRDTDGAHMNPVWNSVDSLRARLALQCF